MATLARPAYPFAFLFASLALCAVELWIVTLPEFAEQASVLAPAVTADLVAGIPLLGYLLLVRPRLLPPLALAPLFIASVFIARMLLPAGQQQYVAPLEALVVLVEVAVLGFLLMKVRQVARVYREVRPDSVYPADALPESLHRVLGGSPFVGVAAGEISLLYHAAVGWFLKYRPPAGRYQAFSYHVRSGYVALFGAVMGLALVELALVHLLVRLWSDTLAAVLTGLSVYGILWLIGDFNAVRLHPLVVGPDALYLRAGLRWRAVIPLSTVRLLRRATAADGEDKSVADVTVAGGAGYVLELCHPVTIQGLLGLRKVAGRIGIAVDEPAAFAQALADRGVPVSP